MKLLTICLLLVLVGWVYVRFAPADNAKFHVDATLAKSPRNGGYRTSFDTLFSPDKILNEIDKTAKNTLKTMHLVGSIETGRITYVSRSAVIGFPDYITVQAAATDTGSTVTILSRLRFGAIDLGVNKARVQTWIKRLQGLGLIKE